MKGASVRAVNMVRRIRDRQAKALAGKGAAEVIAFYRSAGDEAKQAARPAVSGRMTPANKAPQPTSRASRKAQSQQRSRAARG